MNTISPLRSQTPSLVAKRAQPARSEQCESNSPLQDSISLSETSRPSPKSWLQRAKTGVWVACSLAGLGSLAACGPQSPPPKPKQVQVRPAAQQSSTPQSTTRPASSGPRWDLLTSQVEAATRNSVTADELGPQDRRFTALGVDSNQGSKWYHQPGTLEVDNNHTGRRVHEGDVFRECVRQNRDETACSTAKPNQISYTPLSCLYQDEADGQVYRVVHKSLEHRYTRAMDRMVCGGHQLNYNSQDMTYTPSQTNQAGETLYLNPNNILSILPSGQ